MTQWNIIWSTFNTTLELTGGGVAGQKSVKIGANLLTGLGLSHLAGYTVGSFYLDLMIMTDDTNTVVEAVTANFGIMIGDGSMDDTDFPDLAFGDGDYLLRKNIVFQGPGVIGTLVVPESASVLSVTSRAQRRLERIGDTIWLVLQQNVANDFDYIFTITFMARMP